MNWDLVKKIADAVLYEGYILYPYRASSVKNQKRFNFGVLVPPAYSEAQGSGEASAMRTECLVEGDAPAVKVRVRFLHLSSRQVGKLCAGELAHDRDQVPAFEPVPALEIDGRIYQTWQEAVEREVVVAGIDTFECSGHLTQKDFTFGPGHEFELLGDERNGTTGILVRRQRLIQGVVTVEAESLIAGVWRLRVDVRNTTPLLEPSPDARDDVLMYAFASTHTILGVTGGRFVSLLEPGDSLALAAGLCRNVGTWPVLVGQPEARDMMLSSPIILYDYPQVAPESDFDFFDGTEIDEMLALRVMTLTDEEKRLMKSVDSRARGILDRTESLSQEHWMKLHGAIRGLKPSSVPWSETAK